MDLDQLAALKVVVDDAIAKKEKEKKQKEKDQRISRDYNNDYDYYNYDGYN
jgi:hypothetical protein